MPNVTESPGNIAAAGRSVYGKIAAALTIMPAVLDPGPEFSSLGGNAGCLDLGAGLPVHRDEAGGLLDPPQPAADRREGREVEVAAVGDMGVTVQRDVGDGELAGSKILMGLEVVF